MEKNKFAFVILHYYTVDDTIDCVNSIKELEDYDTNVEIVIVDNASPNGSGKEIKEKYENDKKIHVILSKENLGFARGNNLGFDYAKKKLNANFIVLCNNDTKILQKDFLYRVANKYLESSCAVLGPKIILKDGTINKLYLKLPTVNEFKKEIRIFKRNLFCNYIGVESILRKIKKKVIKDKDTTKEEKMEEEHKNIILHGCFLIFTPKYVELFDGLDNRTFMYREEELLAIRLKKSGLISIYDPNIEIFHAEYGSTSAVNKTDKYKRRFFYKNQLKSCKIILDELEGGTKIDRLD